MYLSGCGHAQLHLCVQIKSSDKKYEIICIQTKVQQQKFRGNSALVSLPFPAQAVLCSL